MPLICIGPVCIPFAALIPIIGLLFRPIKAVLPEPASKWLDELGHKIQGWIDAITPSWLKPKRKPHKHEGVTKMPEAWPPFPSEVWALESDADYSVLCERAHAKDAPAAVLTYYTGDFCEPCKKIKPTVEQIAREYKSSIQVIAIDADEYSGSDWYSAVSLPYFEIVRGTTTEASLSLATEEKLRSMVHDYTKKNQ
eukprot:Hpha_TRINITY_DN4838_c0_g1::TRINITY_DN4838_c0_g1_i1::g.20343::m.20343